MPGGRGVRHAECEDRDRGDPEDDRLAVDVGSGHQHLQQQGVQRPQQPGAQLALPAAAGERVQQQASPGERGQPEQGQHEDREPGGVPADPRGQRLAAAGETAVDGGTVPPVLHRPGHGIAKPGEHGRSSEVGVVPGDHHPPVGGVGQMIR